MKKKILLCLLAFLAVFTIVGCGKKNSKKKDRENMGYESSFFIEDDGKYALFNDEGKKLTDFVYTYAGSFKNGATIVEKGDQKGVINSNGKMVIDFGKYKYISRDASLYTVTDEKYQKYLLNAKGKKIADLNDKELSTYISENDEYFSILHDKAKKEFKVLDIDGNTIISFKEVSDDEPTVSSDSGYLSVYYDNTNYIIDLLNGKKILDFKADVHYCINYVDKDGKTMTLNSCVSSYKSQDKVTYRIIKDNKLYDVSDKCDKIYLYDNRFTCTKGYDEYLLDDKFNVGILIDDTYYQNNDVYVRNNEKSFGGVDFYNNGKLVTNVACRKIYDDGYIKDGIFLLSTYYSRDCGTESGTYEFYNAKGEKAFDKTFAKADDFDRNSFAIVSEDKENYYLIDTKGKKVSGDYDSIYARNYYYETRKDGKEGALDTKGNLIVEAKYEDIYEYDHNGDIYLVFNDNDSKYTLYSMDKEKEITKFDGKPDFNDSYISVSKNGKKEYYTYAGKLFYTAK